MDHPETKSKSSAATAWARSQAVTHLAELSRDLRLGQRERMALAELAHALTGPAPDFEFSKVAFDDLCRRMIELGHEQERERSIGIAAKMDCAHRCGVGHEVASAIRTSALPPPR